MLNGADNGNCLTMMRVTSPIYYLLCFRIGHDNAGGGGAWFLDHVEIDSPSLGKKWLFPCGRWLAKKEDDGKLERELWPQDVATEEYIPCESEAFS